MGLYRKKPVVIEAVQYTEYGKLVRGMCNSQSCYTAGTTAPHVHTIHEGQIALLAVGDFIIPEPDGKHFYPVKPDIFAATYEPAGTCTPNDGPFCIVCGYRYDPARECLGHNPNGASTRTSEAHS